jgi:hypothetical protein
MKTSTERRTCHRCQTKYAPELSSTDCPHTSIHESELLRAIRKAGPPYKRPPISEEPQ